MKMFKTIKKILTGLTLAGVLYFGSGTALAEEPKKPEPEKPIQVRLYSDSVFKKDDSSHYTDTAQHDNIIRLKDKKHNIELGLEYNNQNDIVATASKFSLPILDRSLDILLFGREEEERFDREIKLNLNNLLNGTDLGILDLSLGAARVNLEDILQISSNYRWKKDWDASLNFGGGGQVISRDGKIRGGAYAWLYFKPFFAGYNRTFDEHRIVLSLPNKGGPAARYFGIIKDNGFQLHELIATTEATGLPVIASLRALQGNVLSPEDSFLTQPFRFIVPRTSSHGKDWVGSLKYIRLPSKINIYTAELDKHLKDFFVGLQYQFTDRKSNDLIQLMPVVGFKYGPLGLRIGAGYEFREHKPAGEIVVDINF